MCGPIAGLLKPQKAPELRTLVRNVWGSRPSISISKTGVTTSSVCWCRYSMAEGVPHVFRLSAQAMPGRFHQSAWTAPAWCLTVPDTRTLQNFTEPSCQGTGRTCARAPCNWCETYVLIGTMQAWGGTATSVESAALILLLRFLPAASFGMIPRNWIGCGSTNIPSHVFAHTMGSLQTNTKVILPLVIWNPHLPPPPLPPAPPPRAPPRTELPLNP